MSYYSPESAVNAPVPLQSEVLDRRTLNIPNVLRVGMVGLALAAPASANAADTHSNELEVAQNVAQFTEFEELKVQSSLKNKILHNKKLRVFDGDVTWTYIDRNNLGWKYRVRRPIVEKVQQKDGTKVDRYFRIIPGVTKKSQTEFEAVPPDAQEVPQPLTVAAKTSKHLVGFNKKLTPVMSPPRRDKKERPRRVTVGQIKGYGSVREVERLSPGKRFVEQLTTVERLKHIKNVQDFTDVMQAYFSQHGVKVNLRPEDVLQQTGYTMTFLKDSDVGVLKKFGFSLNDEFSKYPKGFLTAVGIRHIDIVNGLYSDGFRYAGAASASTNRLILSLYPNKDGTFYTQETIPHELGHFVTNNVLSSASGDYSIWAGLNAPGFQYTNESGHCRETDIACRSELNDPPLPGVVSRYSLKNPTEDMAETFGAMICNSFEHVKLMAIKDAVVGQKTQFLIRRISQKYPFFNEQYLADVNPTKSC